MRASPCLKYSADITKTRNAFVAKTAVDIATTEKRLNALMCRVSFTALNELKRACRLLHGLAQVYVPNSPKHFESFSLLMQITATLRNLGLAPDVVTPELTAPAADATNVVMTSREYRILKNKYLAALATLADLSSRGVPPGSDDFQSGVREGYRRASEIAILFLEDAETGEI